MPIGDGGGGTDVKDADGNAASVSDEDLNQNVHLTPNTNSAHGVIVAATNNDDIESFSIGIAGAGSCAVMIAAAVNVINATTSAYIGDSALVNNDLTYADSVQDVYVVAANDFRHTSAAAGIAVSGGASVAPAVDVTITNNTTIAAIGSSAVVKAKDDVVVGAYSSQDVLLVAVGLGLRN